MKKSPLSIASLSILSLLLGACDVTVNPPGVSSSSAAPGSESSSSVSGESGSSSSDRSSESSISHSQPSPIYTVTFYIVEGEQYRSFLIEEGGHVDNPGDPEREGYMFQGWFLDKECTIPFDFETKVMHGMAIYAKWKEEGDFSLFDDRFVTTYSPFVFEGELFVGDKDPVLEFSCENIDFSSSISPKQVHLGGSFSSMCVNSVNVNGSAIKVALGGVASKGKGVVAFAKELTPYDEYFASSIEVTQKRSILAHNSVTYEEADGKGVIGFNVKMEGDSIRNPDNLSAADYCSKLQSGEYPYFILSSSENYTLVVTGVSEDFSTIGFQVKLQEKVSAGLLETLKSIELIASKDAFSGGKGMAYPLDFTGYSTQTDLTIWQTDEKKYQGKAIIELSHLTRTDILQQKSNEVNVKRVKENKVVTIEGAKTSITSMGHNPHAISVYFDIESDDFTARTAKIDLTALTLFLEPFPLVKTIWSKESEELVVPPVETVDFDIDMRKETTGTISQTAYSSYSNIRSNVQGQLGKEEVTKAAEFLSRTTSVAKIGYGLYSGDFAMAQNTSGDMFGIDSLRKPTDLIMEQLKAIMEELKVIESKLDNLYNQLGVLQKELENLGQTTILNNFLTAHASWVSFITDYYTPLTDQISLYTNQYFRYYYDLVMKSYMNQSQSFTLYYDYDGELVFPNEYGFDSVDFRPIDDTKTKVIALPSLVCALEGVRANKGHSYLDIENDVLADIANHGNYDDQLISDIAKTMRYYAVKSYFDTKAKMDEFAVVLNNFCRALTGTQLQTAINPLDAYCTMLETVYNFGFEVEPEMNLALIKLSSAFHVATSVADYVHFMNAGSLAQTSSDDELRAQVIAELSSSRFFHPNNNGHPFCYASNCYVAVELNNYKMYFITGEWGKAGITTNGIIDVGEVKSISEADVRLMNLKAKVLNKVKSTNYTFEEYFCSIGAISQKICGSVLGIILEYNGIVHGEKEMIKLTYATKFSYDDRYDSEDIQRNAKTAQEVYDMHLDDYKSAKGKMYSFDVEGEVFTGLMAIGCDAYDDGHGNEMLKDAYFFGNGLYDPHVSADEDSYGGGVSAYYLNIYAV